MTLSRRPPVSLRLMPCRSDCRPADEAKYTAGLFVAGGVVQRVTSVVAIARLMS
jgi:hypothetical protein